MDEREEKKLCAQVEEQHLKQQQPKERRAYEKSAKSNIKQSSMEHRCL